MSNNVINFTVTIGGNAIPVAVELNDTIKSLVKSVNTANDAFDRIGRKSLAFDTLSNVVGKVSQAFDTLVGSSLDFEQQQANLKTLLNGDTQAMESLVAQIREYGKSTVYDKSGLIEAQKTMMAFGLDAEFAFGKLKNIGDIALGDKQKMQSLALAFSQATSTGKLMGQDLMQMINAGFNPLEVISQKTRKSIAQLKDEMSKGKISADLLAQSLEWATEEGGRFYKGAETAADTTAGKIAKIKDQIEDFKLNLFEATNGATAYIAEIGNMLVPLAQLSPLFTIAGKSARWMGLGIQWMFKTWLSFTRSFFKGIWKVTKHFIFLCKDIRLSGGLFHWLKIKAGHALARVRSAVKDTRWKIITMGHAIKTSGGFFPWLAVQAKIACKGIGTAIKGIPIIGWVIAAGTVITTVFTILYTKCEGFRNWLDGIGSLVVMLAGPFGILINLITSFIKHWESIKTAFKDGGIVKGLLRIGYVILDALLKPIHALLKLLSKIPGMGNLFAGADKWIQGLQDKFDAYTTVTPKADTEVLDPEKKKPKAKSKTSDGTLGNTSGTVAGKVQQIHITLGNMVGTMNFNGGLLENKGDVERQLTEMMARILGMAETAA